ncbi:MAG: hypothetical protein RR547_09520, partial [Raoultibacter sp.]
MDNTDKSVKKQAIPISLLACACISVWIFLVIDSHATFRSTEVTVHMVPIIMGVFICLRLCVDAVLSVFGSTIKKLADRHALVLACPICLILGTILVTCVANGWIEGIPVLVAGAALCGIGAELTLVLWLEVFVGLEFDTVKRIILWMIGIQACASTLFFVPFEYLFIICLLLPVLCIAGYYKAKTYSNYDDADKQVHWHKLSLSKALPLGIGIALLYFGFHFLQAGFQGTLSGGIGDYSVETLASILGRWGALIVVFFTIKRMSDFHYESMFKIAGILGICAFLILPLPFDYSFLIFCTITIVACFLTEYAVTLAVVSIASYSDIVPIKLIGWGRAAINTGGLLGVVVGLLLSGLWSSENGSEFLAVAAAAAVLMLVIASVFLLREQAINNFLWGREAADHAVMLFGDENSVSKNCAFLASRYSLTTREAEVLNFLLLGRSTP